MGAAVVRQLSESRADELDADNERHLDEMARRGRMRELELLAHDLHTRKPCRGREIGECVHDGPELVAPCDRHYRTDDVIERLVRIAMSKE